MTELPVYENIEDALVATLPANKTMTDFVTGATGLVGSHLIQRLIDDSHQVKALYRTEIPDIPGKEKVQWIKGDILDVIGLQEAMEKVDNVYHCAAIVSFSPKRKYEIFKTNIEGTANVVNAALYAGVKKLCFVSSVAALGKNNGGKEIDENTPWNEETNTSNYSKSKYLAEVEVWRGIAEGLPAVIVNPSIILGATDWNNSSAKIFKTAYDEFPWFAEGITGFVDVKDVVSAMRGLMENNLTGQRFIVSAENRSYKDIFTLIAATFGKKPPAKKVNAFLAAVVVRLERIKSFLTGKEPLLTRETAEAALSVVRFDNNKLTAALPSFNYTSVEQTVKRVCEELQKKPASHS